MCPIDIESIYLSSAERDEIEAAAIEEQDRRDAQNPAVWVGNGIKVDRNVGFFDDEALTEKELENAYAADLRKLGADVQQQVRTEAGIADIVTSDTVIEVKLKLTRSAIYSAIAQATVYAVCLEKPNRLIVGYFVPGTEKLIEVARRASIEVDLW